MAFTIQNWCRASASANEPIVTLASGTIQGCFREYNYYSPVTDTQVTIATASYFDDVAGDLVTGDYINAYSVNDSNMIRYRVTNTSGVITTTIDTGIVHSTTAITAAQMAALYATSVQLLAAPGANRMYVLEYLLVTLTYVSAQYTAGGAFHVQYTNAANGAGTQASTQTAAASINALTASSSWIEVPVLIAPGANANTINQGLFLGNETQAFATGDSTLVVNCGAKIVPTA